MKKLSVIISLLLCTQVFGAITHVANDVTGSCNSDIASTCAVSYTPTNTGDELVVTGGMFVGVSGVTLTSITDNASGGSSSYTCDFSGTTPLGTGVIAWVCRTCSVKASVTSVTATFSSFGVSHYPGIVITEFTGQKSSACLDQISTSATATGTAVTTSALTPAVTGELSIAFIVEITFASSYAGTNGWTCVNKTDPNNNVTAQCWQIISGTSSTAATATGPNVTWAAYQAMYLPPASGPPPGQFPRVQ